MGARYARAANGIEPERLGLAPRRVLVAMALSVLDADRGEAEAGLYYGGRHRLLGDLGVMPTATSLRHLSGHVATLEQLGLVKRMNRARSGEQAVYKLTFPVDKSRP